MNRAMLTFLIAAMTFVATVAVLAAVVGLRGPASIRMAPVAAVATRPIDCAQWLSGTIHWTSPISWATIDDATHQSTGIASVETYSDHVRINYTFVASKVSSVQVTPDEAFASADVRVGASVGLDHLDLYFFMPSYGTAPVPPGLLTKSGANIWITGLFDLCPVVTP